MGTAFTGRFLNELSLVAAVLAIALCSLPLELSWQNVLYSTGSLALCVAVLASETCGSSSLTNSLLPRQLCLYCAVLLSTAASRVGASERIAQLSLSSLFWQVTPQGHAPRVVLPLALLAQVAQTAVVCSLQVSQRHHVTEFAVFILSAVTVGVLVPGMALLSAAPPRQQTLGPSRSTSDGMAHSSGRHAPAEPRAARNGDAAQGASAAAAGGLTGSATNPGGDPSELPGYGISASSRDDGQGSGSPGSAQGAAHSTTPRSSRSAPALATTACQTDDELLLWLFTGGSIASSAADDVKDDLRASYSGIVSPHHSNHPRDSWAGAKDSSSGGGAGSRSGGKSRSNGVGKYDSFTSVWSRSAAIVGPLVPLSTADGEEGSKGLDDARLSDSSQQGLKSAVGPALGQFPQRPRTSATSGSQSAHQWPHTQQHHHHHHHHHPPPHQLNQQQSPPPPHQRQQQQQTQPRFLARPGMLFPGRTAVAGGANASGGRSWSPSGSTGDAATGSQSVPSTLGNTAAEADPGGAAATPTTRTVALRRRLSRSRTFNVVLSPQRSRVLMGLATTGAGSPIDLPPPTLDEQQLGELPTTPPSPYSEGSEDEAVQQTRAIRALRRSHPELALSLDRFAALLSRQASPKAATAAATSSGGLSGAGASAAAAADATGQPTLAAAAIAGGHREAAAAPSDSASGSSASEWRVAAAGGRTVARAKRPVRRSRSSGLLGRRAAAGGEEDERPLAQDVSLLRLLFAPVPGFPAVPPPRPPADLGPSLPDRAGASDIVRPPVDAGAGADAGTGSAWGRPAVGTAATPPAEDSPMLRLGPVDAEDIAAEVAGGSREDDSRPISTSSKSATQEEQGSQYSLSELSFELELLSLPERQGSSNGAAQNRSLLTSALALEAGAAGASASLVAVAFQDRSAPGRLNAPQPFWDGELPCGGGAAATSLGAAGGGGGIWEGRRSNMRRSLSEGELRFRGPGVQLAHQEHRRASLLQAWQAMKVAETSARLRRRSGSGSGNHSAGASASNISAGSGDGSAVRSHPLPAMAAPTAAAAGVAAAAAGDNLLEVFAVAPNGPSATTPPISTGAAEAPAPPLDSFGSLTISHPLSTADTSLAPISLSVPYAAVRYRMPLPPNRVGVFSAAGAEMAGLQHMGSGGDSHPAGPSDERTVRLCKSLSERSLQLVTGQLASKRRPFRTKSRFALLQQEPSETSDVTVSSLAGSLARISSGGSMGSFALENVLEEQEGEGEGEGEGELEEARAGSRGQVSAAVATKETAPSRLGGSSTSSSADLLSKSVKRRISGTGGGGGQLRHSASGALVALASSAGRYCDSAESGPWFASTGRSPISGRGGSGSGWRLRGVMPGAGGESTSSQSQSLRRMAGRSASELSFAWQGLRLGGSTPWTHIRTHNTSSEGQSEPGDPGRHWSDSGLTGHMEAWLQDAEGSMISRLAPSLASLCSVAAVWPSNSSRGSVYSSAQGQGRGGAQAGSGSVASRAGDHAAATAEGGQPEVEGFTLAGRSSVVFSSGAGGGSRAGAAAAAAHHGSSGAGTGAGGKGSDSDEELLLALAEEARGARVLDISPLHGLREQSRGLREQSRGLREHSRGLREHSGGAPGKTASFRFFAPVVPCSLGPPSPAVVTRPTAAAFATGAAATAAPTAPTAAHPDGAGGGDSTGASPVSAGTGGSAGTGAAATSSPASPTASSHSPGTSRSLPQAARHPDMVPGADDIPFPQLAEPVVPELERERERTRGRSSLDMSRPQGAPPAPAAPAPLSAQNLQHHTRHWEAASPVASNPVALALQLPSPSPSQSGPIDPLSEGDTTPPPTAALLAALHSNVGEAGGAAAAAISSGSAVVAADAVDAARSFVLGGGSSGAFPMPMAVVAARLSMPLLAYNNGEATAIVAAASMAHAGGGSVARGLSRQPSIATAGCLSVGESSGAHTEMLHPPLEDAITSGQRSIERQHTGGLPSHSPSFLGPPSTFGRSVLVRVNSGGAGPGLYGTAGRAGASAARQQSKLAGGSITASGAGGDSVELEVEEVVLANRRLQDDRGVLLEEINIDKVLGFGSMGMVYHGRLYDTKVVVKLIEHGTGVLGKEKERGRLARVEACVSRLLLHPNIVLTYDACTGSLQPGRLAAKLGRGGGGMGGSARGGGRQRCMTIMVQEYCELGTLKDAISKRKHGLLGSDPAGLPVLYRVALDIANGMKHLASLRIIHADLKAENVLLQKVDSSSDRPQGFLAKVADFGLAMVLAPGEDEIRQGIHGTVSHMPPEAMSSTTFSLATDVFGFGVVLWELYTTEAPYRGRAPHEVVEAVCVRGERPAWPPGSPHELVALAQDCWHTDPHQRPSFSDVVERLRHILAPTRGPPERCPSMLSGMTEDSDELEVALRQQRQGGAPAAARRTGAGLVSPSDAGSELGATASGSRQAGGAAGVDMPTLGSSRTGAGDGGDAGVPREAPRDPLGLLLWALCQFPEEPPTRVAGPSPDSEQWVLQLDDMVLRSRRVIEGPREEQEGAEKGQVEEGEEQEEGAQRAEEERDGAVAAATAAAAVAPVEHRSG